METVWGNGSQEMKGFGRTEMYMSGGKCVCVCVCVCVHVRGEV